MSQKDDPINPKHYAFGKIAPIEVIEDWRLDFHLGNAIKYIARAPHKEAMKQDLQKAVWYLQRAIKVLDEGETRG